MALKPNDKTQKIYAVYPRDYMQLYSLLSIEHDKIKLVPKNCDVHPEYDLPYKLLSMIYSTDIYEDFELLRGKPGEKNPLRFYRNGSGQWKDYLFQIPGIYELLGFEREYHIGFYKTDYVTEKLCNIKCSHNDSIIEVFQNPILFLILINQKICNDDFLSYEMEIIDLIIKAISAYTNHEDSNGFDENQLYCCYDFFLDFSRCHAFKAWRVDSDITAIEEVKIKVKKIVDDYTNNTNVRIKKLNHNGEKGAKLSFPKYMRSIILGLHAQHKCLELILPMVNNKTLWTNTDEMVDNDIEDETANAFIYFKQYLCYRSEVNKLLDSSEEFMEEIEELYIKVYNAYHVTIKERRERISRLRKKRLNEDHVINSEKRKKINKILEENRNKCDKILEKEYNKYFASVKQKLKNYYTFCLYTLYKVSVEEKKYKGIAQDAFERVFSIYLFNIETNLLYNKVVELGKKVKEKNDDYSKIGLAKYIFNRLSKKGVHAIYCSPGVYHRVRMVKYICNTRLDIDMLEMFYSLHNGSTENILDDDTVALEVSTINQDYLAAEKECICKWISDKGELSIDDINDKYKLYEEDANLKEYNLYYNNLYSQIESMMNLIHKKGGRRKFTKNQASEVAEAMMEDMPIEKIILHFWVILFSFLSEDAQIKINQFE